MDRRFRAEQLVRIVEAIPEWPYGAAYIGSVATIDIVIRGFPDASPKAYAYIVAVQAIPQDKPWATPSGLMHFGMFADGIAPFDAADDNQPEY